MNILEIAKDKGYTVDRDGNVISPRGVTRKLWYNEKGYAKISIRVGNKNPTMRVHRFVAYFKFGDKIFEPGIQVRHLDGDPANNSWDNIDIGTITENMFDMSSEARKDKAKKASEAARKVNEKLTSEQVRYIRQEYINGKSLARLAYEFNMAKSSMSLIVNRKTYADVA